MSGFISFASGGLPSNIDTTYERIGFASNGAGTTVAANASANTKGDFVTLPGEGTAGVLANDIAGFWVFIQAASSSATRVLVDIAVGADASEVVLIPNIYAAPSTMGSGSSIFYFDLNLAAGARISARCQGSSGSSSCTVSILGEVRTANHPPLWDNCEALVAANTTDTLASSISVTPVTTADTGWTTLVASTAREYGVIVGSIGRNINASTVIQEISVRFGTGAAASEAWFLTVPASTVTSAPYVFRAPGIPTRKTIAASTRVAVEVLAGSVDTALHPQAFGLF